MLFKGEIPESEKEVEEFQAKNGRGKRMKIVTMFGYQNLK